MYSCKSWMASVSHDCSCQFWVTVYYFKYYSLRACKTVRYGLCFVVFFVLMWTDTRFFSAALCVHFFFAAFICTMFSLCVCLNVIMCVCMFFLFVFTSNHNLHLCVSAHNCGKHPSLVLFLY